MDLISNLGLGFDVALTPVNIFYCFVGVLLGTLVGVLPGIGPTGTVAILLPITFTFEPVTALIMLAGIYYGAQYGGSKVKVIGRRIATVPVGPMPGRTPTSVPRRTPTKQ